MQQLNDFLPRLTYAPALGIANTLAALAAGLVAVVIVLHTLHELGRQSPLYHNRQPVNGWNRRFYPASGLLVIFLLLLMWLLRVWDFQLHTR